MAVIINGDTGIDTIVDGSVTTADLASTLDLSGKTMTYGNLPAANLTGSLPAGMGGKILQVVSTTKTDTFSTTAYTSSMATLTGLTASITPSSTSSKILVMISMNLGSASDTVITYQLYRDTTAISQGDAASNRSRVTGVSVYVDGANAMQYGGAPISTQYLDSPSTTSSLTYSVKIGSTVGRSVYCNRTAEDRDTTNYDARSSSTITIMEIAG